MAIELGEAFRPTVPVFDGHAALGRRHDRRVRYESAEQVLEAMDRSGIDRALVYAHYAATFDTRRGNDLLREIVDGKDRLVPQFVANLAAEFSQEAFMESVSAAGVRSLRVHPKDHLYPFVPWVLAPWAEWLIERRLALWLPIDQADPRDIHATAQAFPSLRIVLLGVHYSHHAVVRPLVRSCANLRVELSRYDVPNGAEQMVDLAGPHRVLFGSHYPDLDPAPYLFYLHRCGFSEDVLRAICADNLERLLLGKEGA